MNEETKYTDAELEKMADALLGEDGEAPVRKKSAKKKDKEKEKDPELARKAGEERLHELLEKGKKAGKLSAKELECLEELNLDGEVIDRFYEALEANNIDIDMPAGDVLPALDEDLLPESEDLSSLEQVSEDWMQYE